MVHGRFRESLVVQSTCSGAGLPVLLADLGRIRQRSLLKHPLSPTWPSALNFERFAGHPMGRFAFLSAYAGMLFSKATYT